MTSISRLIVREWHCERYMASSSGGAAALQVAIDSERLHFPDFDEMAYLAAIQNNTDPLIPLEVNE